MSVANYRKIWRKLHTLARDIKTDKDKDEFIAYVNTLAPFIPCGPCRGHFKSYITQHPPTKDQDLFLWAFTFHNAVNERLRKPILTLEEVIEFYKNPPPLPEEPIIVPRPIVRPAIPTTRTAQPAPTPIARQAQPQRVIRPVIRPAVVRPVVQKPLDAMKQ